MSATAGFDPILFDLDGTVVNTVELIRESHRYAVQTVLGREFSDERLVANVGKPLLEQMEAFSPGNAAELYRVYREWNHAHTAELIAAYDGIAPLLERLQAAGRQLGLVTSKSRDAVELAFASLPVGGYFDIIVSADDSAATSPTPSRCASPWRGSAGRPTAAAMSATHPSTSWPGSAPDGSMIGVTWGFFGRSDLEAVRPDILCETAAELGQVLLGVP